MNGLRPGTAKEIRFTDAITGQDTEVDAVAVTDESGKTRFYASRWDAEVAATRVRDYQQRQESISTFRYHGQARQT